MPVILRLFLGSLLIANASLSQTPASWPQSMTPAQAGIDFPIVACRMPTAGNQFRDAFPDARNDSLYIGRGTQLILLHPDGSEETLLDPGPNGACADPVVSYDGQSILFTLFTDPQDINTQRKLSRSPSHIMRIDLQTRQLTQLSFGSEVAWQDSSHQIDPRYASFDVAPTPLPDGRILFLSSRDGTMDVHSRFPAMRFYRMDSDGSNVEATENFTLGSCQHPFILKDGRIVWTHFHPAGRRASGGGNYPLFISNPDGSNASVFAGAHYRVSAWHFGCQLSNGDVICNVYYHQNNFGHGTLVRIPLDPQDPSGNRFGPVSNGTSTWNNYGVNDHFPRLGQTLATPWSMYGALNYGALSYDHASPLMADGSRAGKCTMPAAAPNGDMLLVWSNGNVNALNRPSPELPHMKICFIPGGTAAQRQQMIILKESANWQYLYPKAVVSYRDIYGVDRPVSIPDIANDGSALPILPAGAPFATTGTSSVYNRESAWPGSYNDPFDVNIINNYALMTAFLNVGQDSYAFPNSEIWGAQVVADMSHIDRRYSALGGRLKSHINGSQVWGILGEVALRKFDAQGQAIIDPQGNPDTSYEVRIPADVPFHNRIIDRNGLTLTAEQTWHGARPGERKVNCGGCHAHSNQVSPLDFSLSAAASPNYTIRDFALATPLLTHDAQGNPTIQTQPQKIRIVEYHRDVRPIFQAKCISCHGDSNPAAGLDLEGDDAWDLLAFTDPTLFGHHQATHWVRKQAAAQSLLVWKVFGARLDGRQNGDRSDDVDYQGTIMPPPGSGVPQLSFDEKRTIAQWIDLGCLVDLSPGQPMIGDPFDDQMKPTLVVSGPRKGLSPLPLPPLRIAAYDLHSDLDPNSLTVVITPAQGTPSANLASGVSLQDGVPISLSLPPLNEAQTHIIDISVADQAGNISRRRISITPVQSALVQSVGSGAPGSGGLVPLLSAVGQPRIGNSDFAVRISEASPGSSAELYVTPNLAAQPLSLAAGAFLFLDPADLTLLSATGAAPLASGVTSSNGELDFLFPIPADPNLSGATLHAQALIMDPGGVQLPSGTFASLTQALTLRAGW